MKKQKKAKHWDKGRSPGLHQTVPLVPLDLIMAPLVVPQTLSPNFILGIKWTLSLMHLNTHQNGEYPWNCWCCYLMTSMYLPQWELEQFVSKEFQGSVPDYGYEHYTDLRTSSSYIYLLQDLEESSYTTAGSSGVLWNHLLMLQLGTQLQFCPVRTIHSIDNLNDKVPWRLMWLSQMLNQRFSIDYIVIPQQPSLFRFFKR